MGGGLRYFGGAVAFGLAAIWIMASLAAALVCLLAAVVGYGVGFVADRRRARPATRATSPGISTSSSLSGPSRMPEVGELPQWADALNGDLGHVYEPAATTSPLSADAAYGWPLDDAPGVTSEALH